MKWPVDFWGCISWDSIWALLINFSITAPPVQSPWSQQQSASLMTYLTRVDGSGLYGNQENAMATFFSDSELKKKKYAIEAWPGKKPIAHIYCCDEYCYNFTVYIHVHVVYKVSLYTEQ